MMLCMVVELDRDAPAPSAVRWCQVCGTEVWVSAGMLRAVDAGEVDPHCGECWRGKVDLLGGTVEHRLHPDQIGDLRHFGVLPFAREMVRQENRAARRQRRKR